MRKRNLLFIILIACYCMPKAVKGQTNVLHRTFSFTETVNTPIASDNDFTFENCYAIKGNILQVGGGSGVTLKMGSITTRELGLNGNATILIRTKGSSIKYRVSAYNGNNIISENEFTTTSNISHPNAILLNNGCTSTRLKIEGIDGKFDLISIDVYDIGASNFYESFNNMVADNHILFSTNSSERTAPITKCDNYIGASLSNVIQSEGCILFLDYQTESYETPPISITNGNMAILSFKLAKTSVSGLVLKFKLSCNGGAQMSVINSEILNELSNTQSLPSGSAPNKEEWTLYKVLVTNVSNTTQFTFKAENLYLDDVRLTPYTIIDEALENNTTIVNNVGLCTVTLTRTLGAGYWNTLCLPFDITQNSFVKEMNTSAEIRMLGSVNDGVFHFDEVADDFIIEAGTPFIVKVEKKLENPQFVNVVVKNEPAKEICFDEASYYKFVGTYSPVPLAFDGTNLFLDQNGKLHFPSSEAVRTMKGLRAYFKVPNTSGSTRVNINGEEMDAISNFDIETNIDAPTYDLRGQRHDTNALNKGIYIRDGRKVIVK